MQSRAPFAILYTLRFVYGTERLHPTQMGAIKSALTSNAERLGVRTSLAKRQDLDSVISVMVTRIVSRHSDPISSTVLRQIINRRTDIMTTTVPTALIIQT